MKLMPLMPIYLNIWVNFRIFMKYFSAAYRDKSSYFRHLFCWTLGTSWTCYSKCKICISWWSQKHLFKIPFLDVFHPEQYQMSTSSIHFFHVWTPIPHLNQDWRNLYLFFFLYRLLVFHSSSVSSWYYLIISWYLHVWNGVAVAACIQSTRQPIPDEISNNKIESPFRSVHSRTCAEHCIHLSFTRFSTRDLFLVGQVGAFLATATPFHTWRYQLIIR